MVFECFGNIKIVDIPMLDPYREAMTGESFGSFSYCLEMFEAFIQYQESTDFIKAMESLRGMKLMLKGEDGKALACKEQVLFDTTKHFSEGALKRRDQESLKLQEVEEERKNKRRDKRKRLKSKESNFNKEESTQEVDVAGPEANHNLVNTWETLKKQELNTLDLQNQEEMPNISCQSILSIQTINKHKK